MCTHTQIYGNQNNINYGWAYNRLLSLKRPGESFTDEIMRITAEKADILDYFGAWSDMTSVSEQRLLAAINASKKTRTLEDVRKMTK